MTPRLRFPEFTNEWKARPLNTFLTQSRLKNKDLNFNKSHVLSVAAEAGVVNQIEYHGRSYAGVSVAPYGVVRKGDLVYTKSPLKAYPFGIIKLNEGDDGIVSTLYAIYSVNKHASGKFLNYYFYHPLRINKYLKPLVSIGAKNDMKVNNETVISALVAIPDIVEQEKIADFLMKVDERIGITEKKLKLLQTYKQGVVQKIFSQAVRFKDEDDNLYPEWKEKRLGDIGKFKSGVGFSDSQQGGKAGTPFFKVSDMNLAENESTMTIANNYVSDEQIASNRYRPVKDKSIIFAKVGAAIFLERKRVASNFLIDNNMMALIPDKSVNFEYMRICLDRTRLSRMAQVGALPSYNGSDLAILRIDVPTPEEQQKIANFITTLDARIAAEKSKLTATRQFKKALLQRMFI